MRHWHVKYLILITLWSLGGFGSESWALLHSDFRVFSDSFVSPSFEANQRAHYQFVGMSLQSPSGSEEVFKMDLEGAVAFGAPLLNYLNITEAYVESKQSERETLFVGRKRIPWSDLDQRWSFGLWQPLFQWNPLSPESQGLTGIFWQAERPRYAITIFASPIFIPNQGPAFEISEGAFVRGNPWFRRPPESVRIFKEVTQIDYRFERPTETQVVFQASYGARLSFGDPEEFVAHFSYIYKPSNELAVGYNGELDTSRLRGVVDLKPQVFFHSLSGVDLIQRQGPFRYGVSAVLDRPQKDIEFDEKWTYPKFQEAVLAGPFVEYHQAHFNLSLQSLNVFGGEVVEVGDMASADRAPLTLRYPFQQAVKLTVETPSNFKSQRRWGSRASYTLSDRNQFEFIQWNMNYRWTPLWTGFAELELVRADELTAQNQNEIAQYKNHDRLMLGAAYVF